MAQMDDGEPAVSMTRGLLAHPVWTRWGAHILFWCAYFVVRSAAAASRMPEPADADFPFLINRALVTGTYFALTSLLLLGACLWRAGPAASPAAGPRQALFILGALGLSPIVQYCEQLWPLLLSGAPLDPWPLAAYFFQFGWVLLLWGLMQALLGYHFATVDQARAVLRAQALAYDGQLRALHYQINPHFLFNTLNAISTLVLEKRADLAERMLLRLSGFLRYSLEQNPTELTTLAAELDALKQYLEIEQTRLGDRLGVSIDVEPGLERVRLPSLILQPVLENAVKYAIAPRLDGGRIAVKAYREGASAHILVDDDGPGLPAPEDRRAQGLGLANARERLELIFGAAAGLSAENRVPRGARIHIWLPLEEETREPAAAHFAR